MKIPLTFAFICSFTVPAIHGAPPPLDGRVADQIFQRADRNSDGKVTPDELPNAQAFAKFDLNKDGVILKEEAETALREMARGLAQTNSSDNGKGKAGEFLRKLLGRGGSPAPESSPAEAAASAGIPVVQGPKQLKPGDVGVGRQVADFAFKTLGGKTARLSDWKSQKGVAIVFTSATCPVSKRYAPSIARLEKELKSRDIALLLVNPLASEKPDDIAAQIEDQGLTSPYVHDLDKSVSQALDARTTTEVFLLDSKRTLIYRGALDDQYGVSYNLDAPRETFLLDATTAMLAGMRPAIAATEAPGCELDIPASSTAKGTQVTYHRDVARILQQNCEGCHHDKGIAPFALDDLAEVKDRAKTIKRVLEDRTMPPWFAAPVADGAVNPWANDHSLSTRDKSDLLAWLNSSDRPLGNAADAPAPLKFASEWSIGKPDLIVQLSRPVPVKADGVMPYQFKTVETTLTEDKWVQGYEIIPTAREVVHHVIVNVHAKGARIRGGGDEGDDGYWAAYVPGNSSRVYPDGFARKLPAGSTVSFQIHYTPNGKATEDRLRMGLIFAKEPPRFAMHTAAVINHKLNIPPGEANHVEVGQRTLPADLNVTAFVAHMHVRGKAFRYELITADGKSETLLDIPRYDFNWQLRYQLKEPRVLPRGSTVKVTAVYDNSPGNKANPDPTKTVRWGQQTYDEMMIGYVEYFTPMPAGKTVSAR